jgi:hypothetical protein
MASLAEQVVVTLRQRQKTLSDNISNNNPLLYHLKKSGNHKKDSGGRVITEPLIIAENNTVKWFNGLETFTISEQEVLGAAEFNRKQLAAFVYFSKTDKLENRGKEQAIDLMEARIKTAIKTLENTVATSIYSDGTGSNAKELGGLQLLVDDDPTSAGVVGNIDQVTELYWRNQYQPAQALSSSTIRGAMNLQWLSQVRGTDKPDLILADDDMYNYYESSLQENVRYTTTKSADAGFESIKYKSADVIFDSNCPNKHMYFLNTDYICLRISDGCNFAVGDHRQVTNAMYEVVPIEFAGALTVSNRSLQGVFQAS